MGTHSLQGHGPTPDEAFFHEHGHSEVPTLVQWMLTLDCELRCPHCLAVGEPGGDRLPRALALSLVDQVAEAAVDELLLTGGEPLSHPALPAIVARLAERGVPWSLNTARMPQGESRRALERHPPGFVAVSLDGPRPVHDGFRGRIGSFDEALASMRFFRALGAHVAAGTTVTRRNLEHLTHTMAIVERSAAHRWGLHLLVPEGRARARRELWLRRRDLKRLVRFVEEKRHYVPLEMADELGHCGEREPLLRDMPMTCGAGTRQCVVLPDGEVVPCTTLDRSASAGNLRDRPLLDLWREGFGELRRRRPRGRCGGCGYFPACGGGCWLQGRGEGQRCFEDVWAREPGRLAAAGLVVALGLGSAAACGPGSAPDASHAPTLQPAAELQEIEEAPEPEEAPAPPPEQAQEPEAAPAEPRVEPALVVSAPRGSVNLTAETGSAIEAVIVRLATQGPSRAVAREVRDTTPDDRRSDPGWVFVQTYAEGRLPRGVAPLGVAIRDALGTRERSLGLCALLWRALSERLLDGPPPERRSAADRAAVRATLEALGRHVEAWRAEIYGRRLDPYLARGRTHLRHRFMMLKSRPQPPPEMNLSRDTLEERWGREGQGALEGWLARHPYAEGMRLALSAATPGLAVRSAGRSAPLVADAPFGVHDQLIVPATGAARVAVGWQGGSPLAVSLPAGAELSYADVLRLVDAQHRGALTAPAWRRRAAAGDPRLLPSRRGQRSHRWWLADFWLF